MVRRAVDEAISAADELFREVIDGDLEDLKAKFSISGEESGKDEVEDYPMDTESDDGDDKEEYDEEQADKGGEEELETNEASDPATEQGNAVPSSPPANGADDMSLPSIPALEESTNDA